MAEPPASPAAGPGVRLARAGVPDAERLAAFAAHAFNDAFLATNDPADMAAYVREAFAPARLRAELADPASTFFLALDAAGALAGYAKLRAGPAEACVRGPAPVELERIYVAAGTTGRGVGAALMAACLETAAADGFRTLWLGVWERNPRAIAFYRRWGFEPVGTHPFVLGSDHQTDVVMARPIPA